MEALLLFPSCRAHQRPDPLERDMSAACVGDYGQVLPSSGGNDAGLKILPHNGRVNACPGHCPYHQHPLDPADLAPYPSSRQSAGRGLTAVTVPKRDQQPVLCSLPEFTPGVRIHERPPSRFRHPGALKRIREGYDHDRAGRWALVLEVHRPVTSTLSPARTGTVDETRIPPARSESCT